MKIICPLTPETISWLLYLKNKFSALIFFLTNWIDYKVLATKCISVIFLEIKSFPPVLNKMLQELCHKMNIFWRSLKSNKYFLFMHQWFIHFFAALLWWKHLIILKILTENLLQNACCGIQEAAYDTVSQLWSWKFKKFCRGLRN